MGLSIGGRKLVAKALKTMDQWWWCATGNLWTSCFLFYLTGGISGKCDSLKSIETIVKVVCMCGFKLTWDIAKGKIKYVAKSIVITSYIVARKNLLRQLTKWKYQKIYKCAKSYSLFLKWTSYKIISFQK